MHFCCRAPLPLSRHLAIANLSFALVMQPARFALVFLPLPGNCLRHWAIASFRVSLRGEMLVVVAAGGGGELEGEVTGGFALGSVIVRWKGPSIPLSKLLTWIQ